MRINRLLRGADTLERLLDGLLLRRKIMLRWREMLRPLLSSRRPVLMCSLLMRRNARKTMLRWIGLLRPYLNVRRRRCCLLIKREIMRRQRWCQLLAAWQNRRCQHDLLMLRRQALLHDRLCRAEHREASSMAKRAEERQMSISVRHADGKEVRVVVYGCTKRFAMSLGMELV